MSQTLPDRFRQSPGMSVGLVLGVLIGLLTSHWILWPVIGVILGVAWDRRRRGR